MGLRSADLRTAGAPLKKRHSGRFIKKKISAFSDNVLLKAKNDQMSTITSFTNWLGNRPG